MMQTFLDTILYTCSKLFNNACDLEMATPPKQPDIHDDLNDMDDKADDQNMEEEDDSNENENEQHEPEYSDNECEKSGDSTNEEMMMRKLLSMKYFQEFLLMIHGDVHQKLRNLIQLGVLH